MITIEMKTYIFFKFLTEHVNSVIDRSNKELENQICKRKSELTEGQSSTVQAQDGIVLCKVTVHTS